MYHMTIDASDQRFAVKKFRNLIDPLQALDISASAGCSSLRPQWFLGYALHVSGRSTHPFTMLLLRTRGMSFAPAGPLSRGLLRSTIVSILKDAKWLGLIQFNSRTARNSKPLEVLGTYDPKPQPPRPGDAKGRPFKEIKLDSARARYWVGVGAQPSDTVWRLLSMVRLSS